MPRVIKPVSEMTVTDVIIELIFQNTRIDEICKAAEGSAFETCQTSGLIKPDTRFGKRFVFGGTPIAETHSRQAATLQPYIGNRVEESGRLVFAYLRQMQVIPEEMNVDAFMLLTLPEMEEKFPTYFKDKYCDKEKPTTWHTNLKDLILYARNFKDLDTARASILIATRDINGAEAKLVDDLSQHIVQTISARRNGQFKDLPAEAVFDTKFAEYVAALKVEVKFLDKPYDPEALERHLFSADSYKTFLFLQNGYVDEGQEKPSTFSEALSTAHARCPFDYEEAKKEMDDANTEFQTKLSTLTKGRTERDRKLIKEREMGIHNTHKRDIIKGYFIQGAAIQAFEAAKMPDREIVRIRDLGDTHERLEKK